jgi:hypothetical protein
VVALVLLSPKIIGCATRNFKLARVEYDRRQPHISNNTAAYIGVWSEIPSKSTHCIDVQA